MCVHTRVYVRCTICLKLFKTTMSFFQAHMAALTASLEKYFKNSIVSFSLQIQSAAQPYHIQKKRVNIY